MELFRYHFGPEIAVLGNGAEIADGDTTPGLSDHTDFGWALVSGGSVTRTFTITNSGGSVLHVTGINLSGAQAADFSVGGIALPATVNAGAAETLTVTFDPSDTGLRSATVTVLNDDADESDYDFAIQGAGRAAPAVVYVDDDYTSGNCGGHEWGYDAFATVQAGINAVAAGGTVNVAAGTYVENVVINKALSLLGPNADKPATDPTRGPEAIIYTSINDPEGDQPIVSIEASHVRVAGFTIDGDNPNMSGGYQVGNADVNNGVGIQNGNYNNLVTHIDHITVENNRFKNNTYDGVYLETSYNENHSWNYILRNSFETMWESFQVYAMHVVTASNTMSNVRRGLSMHMVNTACDTGFVPIVVSNVVEISSDPNVLNYGTFSIGIWINGRLQNAPSLMVTSNRIKAPSQMPTGKIFQGIKIWTIEDSTEVVFVDNEVDGNGAGQVGVFAWAISPNASARVLRGQIRNTTVAAVQADTYDPDPNWGGHRDVSLTVENVTIEPTSGIGIQAVVNSGDTTKSSIVTIKSGTAVSAAGVGVTGVVADGARARVNFSGTDAASLSGNLGGYITLLNNGATIPAGEIDATQVQFGGKKGDSMSLDELFAVEDKITHALDTAGLGFVRVKAANVFVTPNTAGVQRGIDTASASDIVNVAAGTYGEAINVQGRQGLTIAGAGRDLVTIKPAVPLDWNVSTYGGTRKTGLRIVDSDNFTLRGVTLDCDLIKGDSRYGFLYWSSTGGLFENNRFKNMSKSNPPYTDMMGYLRCTDCSSAYATVTIMNNEFIDTGRLGLVTHDYINSTIEGNIFEKTTAAFGYAMEIGSLSRATIRNNVIRGFNTPAASDGSPSAGIYVENCFTWNVTTHVDKPVTIVSNEVYNCQYGIYIGNEFDGYAGAVGIVATVEENYLHDNSAVYQNQTVGAGMIIADEDKEHGSSVTVSINRNTFRDNAEDGIFAYTFGDGALDLSIANNFFEGHGVAGFELYETTAGSSSYTINLSQNSFAGQNDGVNNMVNGVTLMAENNWWGSLRGPTSGLNAGGDGAAIVGQVDFSPWLVDGTDTSTDPGFQPNTSPVYYTPHHLEFSQQPGGAALGALLNPQPIVRVINEIGGVALQFNGPISLAIGNNPSGGVLAGTLEVATVDGVATFTDLKVTTHGGTGFTLVATAGGLAGATSAPFDILNPPPTTTGIADFAVDEDAGPTVINLRNVFADVDTPTPDLVFAVTHNSQPGLVAAQVDNDADTLTLTYQHDQNGQATIRVSAADLDGATVEAQFTVTVNPVNDAPVITEGTSVNVTMSEDGSPIAWNLILYATDVENDILTWSILIPAGHGTATASGTGNEKNIGYSPVLNYHGPDSFVVGVDDGNGGTAAITVNVTVRPVNDAPVANDDTATVNASSTTNNIHVLDNDTDIDNEPPSNNGLTVASITQGSHGGTVAIAGDGRSVIYTPVTTFYGTETFTYVVTDGDLNSASATVTVNVVDVTPPTPVCQDLTVQLDASGTATIVAAQVDNGSSDNCAIAGIEIDINNFDCADVGPNSVILTVTDASGNSAQCTATVTVQDVTAPVARCKDLTVQLDENGQVTLLPTQVDNGSTDACGIASMSVEPNHFTCTNIGINMVSLTVTDVNGHTAQCTAQINVEDRMPPWFVSCTSDIVQATDPESCLAIVNYELPVVADNCPWVTMVLLEGLPRGAAFPVGTTRIKYAAVDGYNRQAFCEFTVTVVDLELPSIVAPPDVMTTTDPGRCHATAVALGTPATADNCSVANVLNNAPGQFPVGTTTVTWTVTDGSGNTAQATQTVTVLDNQAPTITAPANVTANADNGQCYATGVALGAPATGDNCSVASVVNSAPGQFPVGTTTVTWTVTDGSGNTAQATQTVTVYDNQAPTITAPANVTVNADNGQCYATGVALGAPATGDNCSVASVVSNAPTQFPVGTTTVTWTVADASGNTAQATQTVTVMDNQLPTITAPPDLTITVVAPNCQALVNLGNPTIVENCSQLTVVNDAPATFGLGVTVVTWNVTDGSGNSASASQTVTVRESLPVITQNPVGQTVTAGSTVQFQVSALSCTEAGYQWYFNGALLAGEVSPVLTLENVQYTDGGNYTVAISNSAGWVTSTIARLRLIPVASNLTSATVEGQLATIQLGGVGMPGASLTYYLVSGPQHGEVTIQDGTAVYIPEALFNGSDSFRYVVTDGYSTSAVATVTIEVAVVNDVRPRAFSNAVNIAVGPMPVALAALDRNQDGRLDVAVADAGLGEIMFLANIGGNMLAYDGELEIGGVPSVLIAKDMNKDNKEDLVMAEAGNTPQFAVWTNVPGTTEYNLSQAVDLPNQNPVALLATDLNKDGLMDVVVVEDEQNTVGIYKQLYDWSFVNITNVPVGASPRGVAAGLLVGDSSLDLVVANMGDDTITVLRGYGNGYFSVAGTYVVGSQPVAVVIADFNRDGRQDIAVANAGSDDVTILTNTVSGVFVVAASYGVGASIGLQPSAMVGADFNKDGKTDLAVALAGCDSVEMLLGTQQARSMFTFYWSDPDAFYAVGDQPIGMVMGDFNKDNSIDVVTVNIGSQDVSLLLNNYVPVAFGQIRTVLEDHPTNVTLYATMGPLDYIVEQFPTNGTWVPASPMNGTMVPPTGLYTPNPDYVGTDTIKFRVTDGFKTSAVATVTLKVQQVNDQPSFVLATNLVVVGEEAVCLFPAFATGIVKGPPNEYAQTIKWLVTVDRPELFLSTAQPQITTYGDLKFTAAKNATGSAQVTVRLQDNGGTAYGGIDTSEAQTFSIVIQNVNDPPVISALGSVLIPEDGSMTYNLTISDPETPADNLLISITSSNTTLLPVDGEHVVVNRNGNNVAITVYPAANLSGRTLLAVTVSDGELTASTSGLLTVSAVNDPPVFTLSRDQITVGTNVNADYAFPVIANQNAGPYEETQTLSYVIVNDNPGLFAIQPTINSLTGNMLFRTKGGTTTGTAVLTVTLRDSGGALSAPQTIRITVSSP